MHPYKGCHQAVSGRCLDLVFHSTDSFQKSEDVKVDKSSDDIPVAVCRFVDCLKYNPSRNIVFSKADVKVGLPWTNSTLVSCVRSFEYMFYLQVYVQILCYAHCCMDFHVGCWKKLWVSQVAVEKVNSPSFLLLSAQASHLTLLFSLGPLQDFLGTSCLTPDCTSTISQIRFIDHGKVKREVCGCSFSLHCLFEWSS